jgi:DNA-binding response OmpR family regulator
MNEFNILIVEDEPIIAKHIAAYLNKNDFWVSGIACDDEEAMHELKNNTPDAVIIGINLKSDTDGIAIAQYINKEMHIPFLFLTSYADKETLAGEKKQNPGDTL